MAPLPPPFRSDGAGSAALRPLRVLATGFEPFGGSPLNPAAVLMESLAGAGAPGCELRTLLLPVVGGEAPGSARALLRAAVDALRPDAVVMFGEAHTRGAVSVERIAVNLRAYRIADNGGATIDDAPVVAGGPDGLFAALPVHRLVEAVLAAGLPAEHSFHAGTFLCNEVMYDTLERRRRDGAPRYAGFVHLPQLPEQREARPVPAAPMGHDEGLRAAQALLGALAAEWARDRERRLELS
ncbi:MAG: hypothetical protein U0625_00840 [Phycisphaerales bacterium]